MSGCCAFGVFLRLGAGTMEDFPSEGGEGPKLMMDSGWESHGSSVGVILDRGVLRMYWPGRFWRERRGSGRRDGFSNIVYLNV